MFNIDGLWAFGVDHFRIEFFVDCILHTIDLGVLQKFSGAVVRLVVDANAFCVEGPTKADRTVSGLRVLRRRLKVRYRVSRAADPHKQISRVKKVTVKMLGKPHNPVLKLKGGESKGFSPLRAFIGAGVRRRAGRPREVARCRWRADGDVPAGDQAGSEGHDASPEEEPHGLRGAVQHHDESGWREAVAQKPCADAHGRQHRPPRESDIIQPTRTNQKTEIPATSRKCPTS